MASAQTLEVYIRSELPARRSRLAEIADLAEKCLTSFPHFFSNDLWPYCVPQSADGERLSTRDSADSSRTAAESIKDDRYSFSTNAMVTFALFAVGVLKDKEPAKGSTLLTPLLAQYRMQGDDSTSRRELAELASKARSSGQRTSEVWIEHRTANVRQQRSVYVALVA